MLKKMWKVLIADDEADMRQCIKVLMQSRADKYNVQLHIEEAEDGEACLEKLKRDEFEVLVLDLSMPKKNGFEVLSEIKELPKKPTTFIVTGYLDCYPALSDLVARKEVEQVIPKPIDLSAIETIFRRANLETPT